MNTTASGMDEGGVQDRDGELLLRVLHASLGVQRRSQFFTWLSSYVHALLPHQVAVCAAYDRARADLVFETFHSVPLSETALRCLGKGDSLLLRPVVTDWARPGALCRIVDTAQLQWRLAPEGQDALQQAQLTDIIVHGSHRPGRPLEVECFFAFAAVKVPQWQPRHQALLSMMLPHLQSTYLRVLELEAQVAPGTASPERSAGRPRMTARERQIMNGVRAGKSNQEISEDLGISPLTVKNHVQKILRKLGAANRAQAVGLAIGRNLLAPEPDPTIA